MKSYELVTTAERIVKELSRRLNAGQIGLQDAEHRIVEFMNRGGDLMLMTMLICLLGADESVGEPDAGPASEATP